MSFLLAIAAMLAAQSGGEQPITVKGLPWAPFISPMGEPFRPNSAGDVPIARWFQQADVNGDGRVTADEMRADAERFFRIIDENGDGMIDPEELTFYEADIAPEVQVNSRWKRTAQSFAETATDKADGAKKARWRADKGIDGYQIDGLQGAARYGLLNLPEPVAAADGDFNRGITREEFGRAAAYRFQLLDSGGTGGLALPNLIARLPARPTLGGQIKRSKHAPDTRIGQPFPAGN
jgi:hypothetical protein